MSSNRPSTIKRTLNNVEYEFNTHGFQAWGYSFDPTPSCTIKRPIEFWRAQLAFRGYSARGSDIEALKVRLRGTKSEVMDAKVAGLGKKMTLLATGSRKRKANEQAGQPRLAPGVRTQVAASAYVGSPAQHAQLIRERPPGFVVRIRLAENDPEKFIREAFYDENGLDAGYRPVELSGLHDANRAHLHQAAGSRLFHETSITNIMIIGSKRNNLAQQRLKQIDRQAGWDEDAKDEDEESDEDESNSESDSDEGEGDQEPCGDEEDDGVWGITGKWKIKCPDMAECFGQSSPYTLEIYTTLRRAERETYGRFDFGEYEGVFRFSTHNAASTEEGKIDIKKT